MKFSFLILSFEMNLIYLNIDFIDYKINSDSIGTKAEIQHYLMISNTLGIIFGCAFVGIFQFKFGRIVFFNLSHIFALANFISFMFAFYFEIYELFILSRLLIGKIFKLGMGFGTQLCVQYCHLIELVPKDHRG